MKLSSLPAAISFEIQPDLYEPGADWTDASQYPEIKALDAFSSKDYQRLAWEVLRRRACPNFCVNGSDFS